MVRKKKKKSKGINSARGRRRAGKTEVTGNILRIIAMIFMIAFYVIMIYSVILYRSQIDDIIDQFNNNNNTLPGAFFTIIRILIKK